MRRWSWIGLAAGVVLGLVDLGMATLLGLRVEIGGRDATVVLFLLFAATLGALGWVAGRLAEALTALRASQRRAMENEKLATLGRAAAGVAHEVRNPLGVIRSSAALLREGLADQEGDGARAAGFIVAEVDRLDGFVRRLLDVSRPITPALRPTELRDLLGRVQALAAAPLEVEADEARCAVDPDLMSQAVLALVVNAREAAGGAGRVQVRARRTPPLRIEVVDDGPGVDPADTARIFEPFVTTRARGIGLGLPTAQRIVEAHGGSLRLESGGLGPGGRGARFVIEVPA